MSDDEDSAPAEAAGPPPPKPPKVVLGLLGANLALSAFILLKVLAVKPAHAGPAHEAPVSTSRELTGELVALDPFVVNLDEPGSPRYLKVTIQAEVRDPADTKIFEKNKTIIHDDVLGYLSGLHVAETLGADNKDHIRTELAARMGKVIGEDRVRRIVFTEFVVQ